MVDDRNRAGPRRYSGAVRALAGALIFAGTAASAQTAGPTMRGDADVGEALAKHWCTQCHLIGGGRSGTDAAPTFQSIARNPAGGPAHLRAFLSQPHPPMPPIPLSGTEIEDLVAFIVRSGAE